MKTSWQLQEAKNKLSEVVERTMKDGPQEITRHGKKVVVVVSMREYKRLKRQKGTLVDFLRRSPLAGIDLDRKKDLPRETSF